MPSLISKLTTQLSKPFPFVMAYAWSKLMTVLWRREFKSAGSGIYLSAGTKIFGGKDIVVGEHFVAGPFLWLEAISQYAGVNYQPSIHIGSFVDFSDSVHIAATTSVRIGDGVLIGSRVHITDHSHGVYTGRVHSDPVLRPISRPLSQGRPVSIGHRVWIGDGVVVLPGVSIGDGTIVGANSVVARSLPSNVIAAGSPAKIIKQYDDKQQNWVRFDYAQGSPVTNN